MFPQRCFGFSCACKPDCACILWQRVSFSADERAAQDCIFLCEYPPGSRMPLDHDILVDIVDMSCIWSARCLAGWDVFAAGCTRNGYVLRGVDSDPVQEDK